MTLIQFDATSGQRIADVVRLVESQANRLNPLDYDAANEQRARSRVFRVCRFSGAWPRGSTKVVTFKNQTTLPNTVLATNLFFPLDTPSGSQRDCGVAKDGTAWYLVSVPLKEETTTLVKQVAEIDKLVYDLKLDDQQVVTGVTFQDCNLNVQKSSIKGVASYKESPKIIYIKETATASLLSISFS